MKDPKYLLEIPNHFQWLENDVFFNVYKVYFVIVSNMLLAKETKMLQYDFYIAAGTIGKYNLNLIDLYHVC